MPAELTTLERELLEACKEALDTIEDLHGYAEHWNWKYGECWDRQEAMLATVIARAEALQAASTPGGTR